MTKITRRNLIKSVASVGIGVGITDLTQTFVEGKQRRTPRGARPTSARTISMNVYRVEIITARVGKPCTFALLKTSNQTDLVSSSSTLVQRLLLEAFFTAAHVEVELFPNSKEVKRVFPFEAGDKPVPLPLNEYRVSRLATQQMPKGGDEHLEAFLVKGQDPEKAYNVYDQLLQQVLEGAFGRGLPPSRAALLHIEFERNEIVMARLGEPQKVIRQTLG